MAEILNVTPETTPEDPSYVQEMVAKAEGRSTQEGGETGSESGKLLAGKYKTEEDLRKGITELLFKDKDTAALEKLYKELESGLGRNKATEQEPSKDEGSDKNDEPEKSPSLQIKEQQEQASNLLKKAGLDLEEFNREFAETGKLSEDSYEKLMKAGFPRQMVDAYIAGLQALAEKQAQQLYEITGGKENYEAMIQWAAVNLSAADRDWFNSVIYTEQATLAVEALWSRYTRAKGNPPKTMLRGGRSVDAEDVYESQAQLIKDMQDPRYETDPAFRRKVAEKLRRSNIL